jgi:5-methyltetrahydropteroyltriglutamate--homocysteine methyltransferase
VTVPSDNGPPFRADHVGSLLRPPELLQARRAWAAGELSEDDLRAREDAAIVEAIAFEESVGLQSITDGEFRRAKYFTHFAAAVDGFSQMEAEIAFVDDSGKPMAYLTDVITGKLRRTRGIAVDEYEFVRAQTQRTPKVTLPSPSGMHHFRWRDEVSDQAYPDLEEFFADLAAVFREELAELGERGATYVQIDDVALPLLCDPEHRQEVAGHGHDPDALVQRYVALTNESLEGRPKGMTIAMHLCRGNNQGKWLGEGSYEQIAEQAFGGIEIDAFFLEYDSERAGGLEPLRFVPDDKHVVLGLVSTKSPELEDRDAILRRIEEASRYVPVERLSLSPQCGFASVEEGNPITPDVQREKLELVVSIADEVW